MSITSIDPAPPPTRWATAVSTVAPPEPTRAASPGLISNWLRDGEFCLGDEFTPAAVERWARRRDIDAQAVLAALEDQRSRTADAWSPAAISVAEDPVSWDELRATRDNACCPVPRWRIGARSGRQVYTFKDCDDSLRCPKHAHRRVERVLSEARRAWLGREVIYWALVEDDGKVINRVRSTRRPGRKAATTWYVKRPGRSGWREVTWVHLWATEDLAGPRTTKPPLSWEPLLPEEALERLADALRLPGVAGISPCWAAKGDKAADQSGEDGRDGEPDEDDDSGGPEPFLSLPASMPENQEEVWALTRRIAKAKWGVDLSPEYAPVDLVSVAEVVEAIIFATKAFRMKRDLERKEAARSVSRVPKGESCEASVTSSP